MRDELEARRCLDCEVMLPAERSTPICNDCVKQRRKTLAARKRNLAAFPGVDIDRIHRTWPAYLRKLGRTT